MKKPFTNRTVISQGCPNGIHIISLWFPTSQTGCQWSQQKSWPHNTWSPWEIITTPHPPLVLVSPRHCWWSMRRAWLLLSPLKCRRIRNVIISVTFICWLFKALIFPRALFCVCSTPVPVSTKVTKRTVGLQAQLWKAQALCHHPCYSITIAALCAGL